MAITGLFFDKRPRIAASPLTFMIFDGTITEDHRHEWVWTDEPVEDIGNVSDNRWKRSVPLTIVVIVSSSGAGGIDRSRHVKAWNQLIALASIEPAQLFTIATTLGDYVNMGIQSISAPVSLATGNTLQATIVAKPISIQLTAAVANLADAAQDSGQASVDLGNQGFAAP